MQSQTPPLTLLKQKLGKERGWQQTVSHQVEVELVRIFLASLSSHSSSSALWKGVGMHTPQARSCVSHTTSWGLIISSSYLESLCTKACVFFPFVNTCRSIWTHGDYFILQIITQYHAIFLVHIILALTFKLSAPWTFLHLCFLFLIYCVLIYFAFKNISSFPVGIQYTLQSYCVFSFWYAAIHFSKEVCYVNITQTSCNHGWGEAFHRWLSLECVVLGLTVCDWFGMTSGYS